MKPIAPEIIATRRLRGERLRSEHESELLRMEQDPRVFPTLSGGPEPPAVADVRRGLDRQRRHWERHGFGLWLLRDRATGAMVGRGGLQYTNVSGTPAVEVAWAIVAERWGEGLATELAHAAVHTAFADIGLTELLAVTLPPNARSRRVMEKAGFAYDRDVVHAGMAHVLYRRARC
ncbi:MAG: GNAT family N-acetyltransferase [Solirubrobacteraceae bacterium]